MPKAIFDPAGSLLVSAATAATTGSGFDFWFAKKPVGQNWSSAQVALSLSPTTFPVDIALAANGSGAAVLGAGFGGIAGLRFIDSAGQLGSVQNRAISQSLGQSSDLSMLANGSAVYSTVEAKSNADASLVARIYQLTSSGQSSSITALDVPKTNASYFFARSTLDGYLLYYTESPLASSSRGFLGSVSAGGNPASFLGVSINNSLERYASFNDPSCPDSQIVLAKSSSSNSNFAGVMRVKETTGSPAVTRCALRYFKNTTGANVSAFPLPLATGVTVFKTNASSVQPKVHLDASERTTIVWVKGSAGTSSGSDAAIELIEVSAGNVIGAPVLVASSSTNFGSILPDSVSFSQNASGTGVLSFLVAEPSSNFLIFALYSAKYVPGTGFSGLKKVLMPANTYVNGATTAVSSAGDAVVIATITTCGILQSTASSIGCGNSTERKLATYQH